MKQEKQNKLEEEVSSINWKEMRTTSQTAADMYFELKTETISEHVTNGVEKRPTKLKSMSDKYDKDFWALKFLYKKHGKKFLEKVTVNFKDYPKEVTKIFEELGFSKMKYKNGVIIYGKIVRKLRDNRGEIYYSDNLSNRHRGKIYYSDNLSKMEDSDYPYGDPQEYKIQILAFNGEKVICRPTYNIDAFCWEKSLGYWSHITGFPDITRITYEYEISQDWITLKDDGYSDSFRFGEPE